MRLATPWIIAIVCGAVARGHETDQFSVPLGRTYANLAPEFSARCCADLARVVEILNRRLPANRAGQDEAALRKRITPDEAADAFLWQITPVAVYIETTDTWLAQPRMAERYPGLLVANRPSPRIYDNPLLMLDPTRLVRLVPCSTVEIDGVWLGTDKLAHFYHAGYLYFKEYQRARSRGLPEGEANLAAVRASQVNLVLSERGVLGLLTTGVVSNADNAANYAGMKFFQNLLEPVTFAGRVLEPMIVWDNGALRLHDRVRPAGDFLSVFATPHWDEVLNPNIYDLGSRPVLQGEIRKRCAAVREWYVDEHGEPRTAEQFSAIEQELRTLYGEDYGHIVDEHEISVAELCFEDPVSLPQRVLEASARGDEAALRAALDEGWEPNADLHAADPLLAAGTTALHIAAGHGRAQAVALLLQAGARVDAKTARGVTPLHKAVPHSEVLGRLLAAGADVNAPDRLRQTPLHWAVRSRAATGVALLLAARANINARDLDDETALHLAARTRSAACARRLLQAGAAPDEKNRYGQTPVHLVVAYGDEVLLGILLENRGPVGVPDCFGETPLQLAVRRGDALLARLLGAAGTPSAPPDRAEQERAQSEGRTTDSSGREPVHVAPQAEVSSVRKMSPTTARPGGTAP